MDTKLIPFNDIAYLFRVYLLSILIILRDSLNFHFRSLLAVVALIKAVIGLRLRTLVAVRSATALVPQVALFLVVVEGLVAACLEDGGHILRVLGVGAGVLLLLLLLRLFLVLIIHVRECVLLAIHFLLLMHTYKRVHRMLAYCRQCVHSLIS